MSVELTPDPESTSNFHDPVHLDIESLSEITNKPLAIVYYGDQFDPNKDFHVITLDEPRRDIRARYPHPSPWAPALNPVVSYSRPSLDIANTYSKPNPQASAGFSAEFSDYRYKEGAVRRRPHSSRYQNIFSNSKYLSSLPFQVIHGSEFTPKESLEPYTNRLYGGRRELFKWAPPANILESTFISY